MGRSVLRPGAGFSIEGVDVAGLFADNPFSNVLTLREQSVEAWTPSRRYTLVTCVHGLHYVGDKLAVLAKAAGTLALDGRLVANLDLAAFYDEDGRPAGRTIASRLRANGFR